MSSLSSYLSLGEDAVVKPAIAASAFLVYNSLLQGQPLNSNSAFDAAAVALAELGGDMASRALKSRMGSFGGAVVDVMLTPISTGAMLAGIQYLGYFPAESMEAAFLEGVGYSTAASYFSAPLSASLGY
jgi:hypothetical protein